MSTAKSAPKSTPKPSFLRGLFAGEISDDLLFPYPAPLDERNPGEAATVRRLVDALNAMVATGLLRYTGLQDGR